MKSVLENTYVRLGLLVLVVIVPGLLATNAVLLRVRVLEKEVTAYNETCSVMKGLNLLSIEPEATPTATPKTKALGPTGPTKAVPVEVTPGQ